MMRQRVGQPALFIGWKDKSFAGLAMRQESASPYTALTRTASRWASEVSKCVVILSGARRSEESRF